MRKMKKMVKVVVFLLVLAGGFLTVAADGFAALIQPWMGFAVVPKTAAVTSQVTLEIALVDTDGKMVTGLTAANFKLYNVVGFGLPNPGAFNFGVKALTPAGVYLLTIKPAVGNAWSGTPQNYRFSFVVSANSLSNGVGEVFIMDKIGESESAADEQSRLLKMLSPFPFTAN